MATGGHKEFKIGEDANPDSNKTPSSNNNSNEKDNYQKKSSKNNSQTQYSRTYDAHTTDDSDEDSNSKNKRSLLKHRNPNQYYPQNLNLHHTTLHSQQNKKNSNNQQNPNFQNHSKSKSNIKPCLVHRNSVTSDEEYFSNQKNTKTKGTEALSENDLNSQVLLIDKSTSPFHLRQGILKTSREASLNNDTDNKIEDFLELNNESQVNQSKIPVIQANPSSSSSSSSSSSASPPPQQSQHEHKSRSASFKSNIPLATNKNTISLKSTFIPISSPGKLSFSASSPFKNSKEKVCKASSTLSLNTIGLNSSANITLVVDEVRFVIDPELFKQHPNTMLGRMFSSSLENKPNERGEYSVAYGISATIFKAVLDYYKHGIIRCPPSVTVTDLKEACDYLLIPFDGNTIRCHDLRGLLNE